MFCVTMQEGGVLLDGSSCIVRDKRRFSVSQVAGKAVSDCESWLWG